METIKFIKNLWRKISEHLDKVTKQEEEYKKWCIKNKVSYKNPFGPDDFGGF